MLLTSPLSSPLKNPARDVFSRPFSDGALSPATLVIFAGQSNSIGWSTDPVNTTALTAGRGYEFRQTGGTGVYMPLGQTLLGRVQGGPQAAFAQTWTTGGGGVALCVNVGVNGASLVDAGKTAQTGNIATNGYEDLGGGTWDLAAGGLGSLYTQTGGAKSIIDKAITAAAAAGFSISKKIVVWAQGEQDGNAAGLVNPATYDTNLRNLIDRFVSDYAINAFLISGLGTPGGSANTYWDDIRVAQLTAAAARSSVATVAFTGATAFYGAGKMVDTLHYTQTGYNEMGAGLATNGLAFIGGLSLATPAASIYSGIVANPPQLDRWKRLVMTTTRSGSFAPSIYSAGTTPVAPTWVDASGSNKTRAAQTAAMTFGSAASKNVTLYVSDSIGASGSFVPGGNTSISAFAVPDSGLRLNTFNANTAGDMTTGCTFPNADIKRLAPAVARSFYALGPNAIALDNSVLTTLNGLTGIILNQSSTPLLDVTIVTNVTTFNQSQVGLSVSDVNTILQALDANGKSGGSCNLTQYRLAPPISASAPTGAGVTAKTNLIGKGWSVFTD